MCVLLNWVLLFRAAADHELAEDEVVQARLRGDVPALHVHLPLLPRVSGLYLLMCPGTMTHHLPQAMFLESRV